MLSPYSMIDDLENFAEYKNTNLEDFKSGVAMCKILSLTDKESTSQLQDMFDYEHRVRSIGTTDIHVKHIFMIQDDNQLEVGFEFEVDCGDNPSYDTVISKIMFGKPTQELVHNMTQLQFIAWIYSLYCHRISEATY